MCLRPIIFKDLSLPKAKIPYQESLSLSRSLCLAEQNEFLQKQDANVMKLDNNKVEFGIV